MGQKQHETAILKEIEHKFSVEKITYKNQPIWPILRVYIGAYLVFGKQSYQVDKKKVLKQTLRYFFKGFFLWFKKYEYIVISTSDQRRSIEGKWVDRFDYVPDSYGKGLFIETPINKHYSRKKTPSKIASQMPIYLLEYIYIKLFKVKRRNFEGYDILEEIFKKYKIDIQPEFNIKRFFAQKWSMNILLKLLKPKRLFTTVPYTKLGYLATCKKKNVTVIEGQHGVVNNSHFAYSPIKSIDQSLSPDFFFSFGKQEVAVFKNNAYISSERVIPVGSFYLDFISRQTDANYIKQTFKNYGIYIALVLQDMYDKIFLNFVLPIIKEQKDKLFILIPRKKTKSYYKEQYQLPENTVFVDERNTYEIIRDCDFHTTINSTTAIEAPVLGTQNILINIQNLSQEYYGEILNKEKITIYCDDKDSYISAINNTKVLPAENIKEESKHLYTSCYAENFITALEQV